MAEELLDSEASGVADAEPAPAGGLSEARGCIGAKLEDVGGSTVGKVEQVLADTETGVPTWLVVRLGRFGKRAAVPFDYVVPGAGRAWVPFERDVVRAAAELDPTIGLTAGDERALANHYGVPEGSGRDGVVAGRGDEDPGSVVV